MELSKADQDLHDKMLRIWVSELRKRGYTNIRASLSEFTDRPGQLGGSVPDLTAQDERGRGSIGEVKTSNDVNNEHTRGQLAHYVKTRSHVMLMVPESYRSSTERIVRDWGFGDDVEIWHVTGT